MTTLTQGGLKYSLAENAFLSPPEAAYALERLATLCGVDKDLKGGPSIGIPCVTRNDVGQIIASKAGQLLWIELEAVLPTGVTATFDTAALPAFCLSTDSAWTPTHVGNVFPFDLVAFAFLMLTRWEEANMTLARDQHGRVRTTEMFAYRQGFHRRPVIDEWALILREWLRAINPDSIQPLPQPRLFVTHDVDALSMYPSIGRIFLKFAAELAIHRKGFGMGFRALRNGLKVWRNREVDPYVNALVALMEIDTHLGVCGHFYIKTSHASRFDSGYNPFANPCRAIIEMVRQRGHMIGWHPGYFAGENAELFAQEKARMDRLCGGETYGGRHHYLRWDARRSWDLWDRFDLLYDSSVGFPDATGFRCGTAHPYPVFSLNQQRELRLVERPLHVMDKGLERECQGTGTFAKNMNEILRRVRAVGGEAVILLHNSYPNAHVIGALLDELGRFVNPLAEQTELWNWNYSV
jgi:hypothetical protein